MNDEEAVQRIIAQVAPELYAAGVRQISVTMAVTGNPTMSVSVGTEADVAYLDGLEFFKKEQGK